MRFSVLILIIIVFKVCEVVLVHAVDGYCEGERKDERYRGRRNILDWYILRKINQFSRAHSKSEIAQQPTSVAMCLSEWKTCR